MGLFDKIKGFMVEQPEGTEEVSIKATPAKEDAIIPTSKSENKELFNDLMTSIQNGEYTQFFDMVNSLKEDISDEGACYKAAFKTVQKISPLSTSKLLLRVDDCLTALEGKRKEFAEGVEEKLVDAKKMESEIQEKGKAIDELQQQIAAITAERTKISADAQTMRVKISNVSVEFDKTAKAVEFTLAQNKKKITTYLK